MVSKTVYHEGADLELESLANRKPMKGVKGQMTRYAQYTLGNQRQCQSLKAGHDFQTRCVGFCLDLNEDD